MNTYFNILVKLMILLVFLLLAIFGLYFANVLNFSFDNFRDEENPKSIKRDSNENSAEKINKINDSINQREDRIKALKEIGKKLGG